jgi:type IV secretory pathway VirB2 component (pilin)
MQRSYASLAGLLFLGAGGSAFAQVAGGDPAGSSPITGALLWIQGTLLGNLATTAAVIAVAVVGLLMLTGRIDWKRGLTVIVGAFILFGAASIVAGIRSAAGLHT